MEQNASIVHDGTGAIRSYFGDCYHFSEIARHFFMNFENLQFADELLTCGLKSADAAIVRIKKIRALGQRRTRKHDHNGHIWTTQPKTHLTQAVISTHVCKHTTP